MKLKTILKGNGNIIEGIYDYTINNNIITYFENGLKVTIIKSKNIEIIRENDEYILKMLFIDKEVTNNEFILKENNLKLNIEINTLSLNITNDTIDIVYEINNEIKELKIFLGGQNDN